MNARAIIQADLNSGAAGEVEADELYAFVDYCNAAIFETERFYLPDETAPRALNCHATMDIIRDVAQIYKWD